MSQPHRINLWPASWFSSPSCLILSAVYCTGSGNIIYFRLRFVYLRNQMSTFLRLCYLTSWWNSFLSLVNCATMALFSAHLKCWGPKAGLQWHFLTMHVRFESSHVIFGAWAEAYREPQYLEKVLACFRGFNKSNKCALQLRLCVCVCVCVCARARTREAVPLSIIMSLKAPPPPILNPLYPLIPRQTFTNKHQLPTTSKVPCCGAPDSFQFTCCWSVRTDEGKKASGVLSSCPHVLLSAVESRMNEEVVPVR